MTTQTVVPVDRVMQRRGTLSAEVLDTETRVLRVSFSSEIPYERRSWDDGPWIEILGHRPGEVALERLNAGGPVLYGHNVFDRQAHVGVVTRAWIEGGRGLAEIRLSKRADVDDLWQDVKDGIVTCVSVGYKIHARTLVKKVDNGLSEYRVTRWEPVELSLVAIPADPTVGIGRAAGPTESQTFPISRSEPMPEIHQPPAPNSAPPAGVPNIEAERQRAASILEIVNLAKLPQEFAAHCIRRELTVEQTRAAVFDELARNDVHHFPRSEGHVPFDAHNGAESEFVRAAAEALALRGGISVQDPSPATRDLRGMSVVEIARTCLSRRGGARTSYLAPVQILQRAMSTSDFPAVLANTVHIAMRRGFEQEPASHRAWVRMSTVPNFKEQQRVILGSGPDLLPVGELGEYKYGSMDEDKATYSVEKFGRAIGISWEALVNDDLGAFTKMPTVFGQSARRAEADKVYTGLLLANSGAGQTMQDAQTLFHATHNNLSAVGLSLSVEGLTAARVMLRKQTAVGGGILNIIPRFLLVPAELETDAEVLLSSATVHKNAAATTEATTPDWMSRLQLVVEPRLPNTAFYVIGDSAQIDTFELAYLEGEHGPVVIQEQEFNRDAQNHKCRHVFGGRFLDWRGMVKIPTG